MPLQVFIGASSKDYTFAQEVYDFLVGHGIDVFFSQESLPRLGSSDYRKQIDAALDQAIHMVVVTSSAENVRSTWLESEWGFFVNEKRSGHKDGNLVTVIAGAMTPRDLPPSLRYYEVIPFAQLERVLFYLGGSSPPVEFSGPAVSNTEGAVRPNDDNWEGKVSGAVPADTVRPQDEPPQGLVPAVVGSETDNRDRFGTAVTAVRKFHGARLGVLLVSVAATLLFAVMAYRSKSSQPASSGNATQPPVPISSTPDRATRFNRDAWNLPNDELWGFVEIPAGEFTMGSDKNIDPTARDHELPQHKLTLPAYFIGKYEVTVGQYKACINDGGCTPQDKSALTGADDNPVRYIAWREALAYCDWLERKLRASSATPKLIAEALASRGDSQAYHISLPSEAEWERAARGTGARRYPWGTEIDKTKANYQAADVAAVGSFPKGRTPEGVYDMAGNVDEWTRSKVMPYPYVGGEGRERLDETNVLRVMRGGSFGDDANGVRAASRDWYLDFSPSDTKRTGFRVVSSRLRP